MRILKKLNKISLQIEEKKLTSLLELKDKLLDEVHMNAFNDEELSKLTTYHKELNQRIDNQLIIIDKWTNYKIN